MTLICGFCTASKSVCLGKGTLSNTECSRTRPLLSPPPSKPQKSSTPAHRGQHCPCSRCCLVLGNSVGFVSCTEATPRLAPSAHSPSGAGAGISGSLGRPRLQGLPQAKLGSVLSCLGKRRCSGRTEPPSLQRRLGNRCSLRQGHTPLPGCGGAGALSLRWEEGLRQSLA